MAVLSRKRNKTVTGKLRRNIAFAGWRRNIGAREKIEAKELRSKQSILGQTFISLPIGWKNIAVRYLE